MANLDRPRGFKIVGSLGGGEVGRSKQYKLAAANSIIGIGDLLVADADGCVNRAAASATAIVGVALESKAANDGTYIMVNDDPNVILEAQTDNGVGTLTAQTGINLNANFVVADAVMGLSRMEIDESSGDPTATLPLKVIGLSPAIDNAFGEFNRLLVIINNHTYKSVGTLGL